MGEKKANPGYTCDATESSGAIQDSIGLATSASNCSGNNTLQKFCWNCRLSSAG